mmetsp:Transcript_75513/g.194639  ORF Transcript_75513/g.194639 Transcript_75513/m.194639 type:complete len:194 (+) Transcript_75513:103-684(+)|eukprot:CAMPEP_0195082648 /NCGR_PEP_ID=MMETSP0448-20130528/23785_1 /TAXON_ID=66468 /ORGANISM="Heterocapsa triquestra, Strain CCMP 448" /LENGTH=193 /DNA_ID=CAMNT_0040115777 /DNA_START=103 /DNA_END=684 /DNA_ORIENTATION=-
MALAPAAEEAPAPVSLVKSAKPRAPAGSMHSPPRRPAGAARKNAFAALDSDSGPESDAPPTTAATGSPTESLCSESDTEAPATDSGAMEGAAAAADGWAVRKQRPRRAKEAGSGDGASAAESAAVSAGASGQAARDDEAPEDDWVLRKGQRHGHSKLQKQEWSAKAQRRVGAAKQKRVDQRSRQLMALAEGDD